VVLNKADIVKLDELIPEKRAQLAPIESEDVPVMEMSTVTGQGVMEVKQEVRPSSHLCWSANLHAHIIFCSLVMSPAPVQWSGLIVFYTCYFPSACVVVVFVEVELYNMFQYQNFRKYVLHVNVIL
jgi:hypothetical protein